MRDFPDTSFLCSLYRLQVYSSVAVTYAQALTGPLPVSTLLLLEFRQSVRLQARLFANDRTRGFSHHEGVAMLRNLQDDLSSNVLRITPVDWGDVHQIAEGLSAKHTENRGHRLADILHIATALHLGAAAFLTFDSNQRALAAVEGMDVPL
jgi:predicted nucleic acid-binding protein